MPRELVLPGAIEPVIHFSFDTLDNVKLYEHDKEEHFDALVDGRVRIST